VEIFKRPALFIIVVLSLGVAATVVYVDYNNKKIEAKYREVLSQSCSFAQRAITDIYDAVSSDSMSYSEILVKTRQSEQELETAKRILDYGKIGIDSVGMSTRSAKSFTYSWDMSMLKRLIELTISDSIDIAIAIGDIESIQDGSAEEGVELAQRRAVGATSTCSEYKLN